MQKSLVIVLVTALIGAFLFFQFGGGMTPAIAFIAGALITAVVFSVTGSQGNAASSASSEPYVGPTMTLYVGNLPYRVHEGEVRELFGEYGPVNSVRLVRDRKTGRRKGFGFVEMSEDGAQKAMAKLNDYTFQERTLKVREAKSQENDSDNNSN